MIIEFGVKIRGKVSHFGGPLDTGVAADEGLAIFNTVDQMPQIFLKEQPEGTTGLARRLDPDTLYCACRWDYSITPKSILRHSIVRIENEKNAKHCYAVPCDFGPAVFTNRVIDVSEGVMKMLGLETDDVVNFTLMPIKAIEA